MQKLTSGILIFILTAATLAMPSASVPRKSPELTIYEPSGKTTLLSSFKGKVVMIEFFFIRSPRCIEVAKTMNKLNAELGASGFQPIAIAFPAPNSDVSGLLVGTVVNYLKLNYPVGYINNKDEVDRYLSREQDEVLRIPQVVIIDRTGMIRAQTGGRDANLKLEDEAYLRTLLDGLLKESRPPDKPARRLEKNLL